MHSPPCPPSPWHVDLLPGVDALKLDSPLWTLALAAGICHPPTLHHHALQQLSASSLRAISLACCCHGGGHQATAGGQGLQPQPVHVVGVGCKGMRSREKAAVVGDTGTECNHTGVGEVADKRCTCLQSCPPDSQSTAVRCWLHQLFACSPFDSLTLSCPLLTFCRVCPGASWVHLL